MLPLSLLGTVPYLPTLVELNTGETYHGYLVSYDNWMNINLCEVIYTSRDGDKFWSMPECFIRGSTIKFLHIPEEVIDDMESDNIMRGNGGQRGGRGGGRGSFVGRGGDTVRRGGPKECPHINIKTR